MVRAGHGAAIVAGALAEPGAAVRAHVLDRHHATGGAAEQADLFAEWVRASAEALPIAPATVDLVFLYLVYHHLRDPVAALRECARILTLDGRLLVINATAEILDFIRWLPFFPSARQIDLARLPTRTEVSRVAQEAGLTVVRQGMVVDPAAPNLRVYADRVASRTFSTLQLISDQEFEHGAAAFRQHCDREDHGQVVEEVIDTFLFRRRL